jgi:hypothetical protein
MNRPTDVELAAPAPVRLFALATGHDQWILPNQA